MKRFRMKTSFVLIAFVFCVFSAFSQNVSVKTKETVNETVNSAKNAGATGTNSGNEIISTETQSCVTGVNYSVVNSSCGNPNGVLMISGGTGGTAPYTYSFNGSSYSSNTFYTGLIAGSYSLSVMGSDIFCTTPYTTTVIIINMPGPTGINGGGSPAHCGMNNGLFTVSSVVGGTAPYTYSLDGGSFVTSTSFTGLAPGTHTITVKDANGCIYNQPLSIGNMPGPTQLIVTTTNATCGNPNGIITINSVTGGTGPYTYSLNGGAYSPLTNYTGLSAGNYSISVQDAWGCILSTNRSITNLAGPTAIFTTLTNATCGINNGVINITGVNGFYGPFTYSINGGAFGGTSTFMNLSAGTYNLTVKDVNGCTYSTNVNINAIPPLTQLLLSSTNSTCGNPNGTITVNSVMGGTAPYQYSINNGAFSPNPNFIGLYPDNYTIMAKDANNCNIGTSRIVNNIPGPNDLTAYSTNSTCGNNNGSITILNSAGGTPPFSYSLNGGIFESTTYFPNLAAGSYTATVKDANGCIFSLPVTILNMAGPVANLSSTEILCNGESSTVLVTAIGGTMPITGTGTFTVPAGTYNYTLTDANGCIANTSVLITEPTILEISTSTTSVSCNSSNNGTATVISSGGTTPYSYLWNNNSTATFNAGVTAGTYSVTVTDAKGCTISASDDVNWVGPCDTKVRTSDCGITVNNIAKYIYCDVVIGATDYEWEFISGTFSFTRTKDNENTGFYLSWVTGIEYGKTYNVRVRAYKNGVWGTFSTVCQITTGAVPTTKVRADYCGTTVNNLTQYLYCDAVAGAGDYEWEFTNTASNFSVTKTRGLASNSMSLSLITGLEYDKTYNVRVRVKVGTQWSDFGTVCTITTPSIPSTKVQIDYCGITVISLSHYFYCDAVQGATNYEWEFTNTETSLSTVVTKGSSSYSMSFASVSGAKFNITYDVRVRAKIGTQWGSFATVCQISTPAFPTTQVRADYCGITTTSLTQYVYCDAVKGATDYEWKFDNTAGNFSFSKIRGTSATAMNLSWITGIANNTIYDVSVRAKVGGVWGIFGTVCQITTPSVAKLQNNDTNEESKLEVRGSKLEVRGSKLEAGISNFQHPASNLELPTSNLELSLMPNPVNKGNSFFVSLQSDANINGTTVNIYNIIGQIIYTKKINVDTNYYTLNIEQNSNFNSGLFIIQAEINGEVKRLKMIVE